MAEATQKKTDPVLVKSPGPAHKPQPNDPPMDMDRLRAWRDDPSPTNTRLAFELIERCGDGVPSDTPADQARHYPRALVLDGVSYQIRNGKITPIPVEYLGLQRAQLAAGIERGLQLGGE